MHNRQERNPTQEQTIAQVKVQWKHFGPDEATWEMEDAMKHAYPFLFTFTYRAHRQVEHRGRCSFKGEGIVIPMFPPACKYNYNLLKDYGQTEYVWMLELMNLFVIKGNVYIFVTK
jgi:hypothetical protein